MPQSPNAHSSAKDVESRQLGSIEARFNEFARRWHESTDDLSTVQRIISDPNYVAIIALGRDVVPLILDDLRANGGYWFTALTQLTGESPESEEDLQSRNDMRLAWLNWGEREFSRAS